MPRPILDRLRPLDQRWVSTLARLAVGVIFAYSGATKVVDIDGTIRAVRAYQLLPESVVPAFGSALPLLELALAALLLLGLATRLAATVSGLLFIAFLFGVSQAWIRGLSIECGCFGGGGLTPNPVPGYVRELVLDTVLLAACVTLIARPRSRFSLDQALGLVPEDVVVDTGGDVRPDGPTTPPTSRDSTRTRRPGAVR